MVVLCFPRFSRRCKSQEQEILKQGIQAPDAPMAGPEKLPAAMQKGPTLYSGNLAEPHLLSCHQTLLGRQNSRGGRNLRPFPRLHHLIKDFLSLHQHYPHQHYPSLSLSFYHVCSFLQLPTVSSTVPGTSQVMFFNLPLPSAMPPSAQTQTSSQDVPYSTQQYRKRKQEREQTGTVTRKYVRKTDVILCRKCNKERKPPSHLQYFGNWYCKESETQSYGEWRAVLEERGYRKKKTGNDNTPAS